MSTKNKLRTTIKTSPSELLYKNQISWTYFIPLLLIAGFVPLIVYGKYINLTGTTQALFWTGQNELLDFFSYCKSRWVIFLTITSTIIYIFLLFTKKLTLKKEYKYYVPLAIYAFFVILSTIFAVDKPTALNGFVDMYQGMWVLLCYVMITFLVINFVNSERDVKLFVNAFIFLIIVEGIIGVGQYFGFDIFNTKFGNSLIIPSGIRVDGGLSFNFGKHTIYGTLFNTNFVGSFAALMLPIAVAFLIGVKTLKERIIAGSALVLCLFTWIGCNSRAGYVGIAFSTLVALVILRKDIVKHWKVSVAVLFIGIVGLVGFNFISGGILEKRLDGLNVFKSLNEERSNKLFVIEDIDVKDNSMSIKTNLNGVYLEKIGNNIYFFDDEKTPLLLDESNRLVNSKGNYTGFNFIMSQSYPGAELSMETGRGWVRVLLYFSNDKIEFLGSGNKIVKFNKDIKYFKPLIGLETFMSGRGYIWGTSIGIIQKYIIHGSGADCFPIAFPNDISLYKVNSLMHSNTVIDKPHNMYLQIAINTGFLSLIALLVVWSIYIFNSIKLYCRLQLNSIYEYIGMACFISIIGYLFAGIFNDHIVSISPIFWCVFGLGININVKLKTKEEDRNV